MNVCSLHFQMLVSLWLCPRHHMYLVCIVLAGRYMSDIFDAASFGRVGKIQ